MELASLAERDQVSRQLSAEEIELWRAVTATVRPRDPRKLAAVRPQPEQKPAPKSEHRILVETSTKAKPMLRPLGSIDRRQQKELSKGRLQIDARIDLHGRRVADNLKFMSPSAKEQERLSFLAEVVAGTTLRRRPT